MAAHFSFQKLKRSLTHFAIGKVVSGIIGILTLLLLVRALSPNDFGVYVTLLALFEVVQLGSSFGLLASAQRYVTDCRISGTGKQLKQLVRNLLIWRLITLSLVSAVFWLISKPLMQYFGIADNQHVLDIYLIVIVSEGVSRLLDLIFESLLLQGQAQVSILVRNGAKLIGFAILFFSLSEVTLFSVIQVEVITTVLGMIISVGLVYQYLNKVKADRDQNKMLAGYKFPKTFNRFSYQFYLAQLVGLAYGPDVVKMLVAKIFGMVEAAVFGFAFAVITILRRYMPAYLLLGMVRPIFVAKKTSGATFGEVNELMNLVLKINVFFLVPVMLFFLLYGEEFSVWVTHGKYPQAGHLLVAMSVLLGLQTLHGILGVLVIAYEKAGVSLLGTVIGLGGLLIGLYASAQWQVYGLVLGLSLSELIWCATVILGFRQVGYHIGFDWLGLGKFMLIAILTAGVLIVVNIEMSNMTGIIIGSILLLIVYSFIAMIMKPFNSNERNTINRLLPRAWFVW